MREAATSVWASGPILTFHSPPDESVTRYVMLKPRGSRSITRYCASTAAPTIQPAAPAFRLRAPGCVSIQSSGSVVEPAATTAHQSTNPQRIAAADDRRERFITDEHSQVRCQLNVPAQRISGSGLALTAAR